MHTGNEPNDAMDSPLLSLIISSKIGLCNTPGFDIQEFDDFQLNAFDVYEGSHIGTCAGFEVRPNFEVKVIFHMFNQW